MAKGRRARENIKKAECGGRDRRTISKNIRRNKWNYREAEVREMFKKLSAVPRGTEKIRKKERN